MITPEYVYGHAIWTYLTAVIYAAAGTLLVVGKRTRAAATCLGVTVLFIDVVVYVPIAVVERATLTGVNYVADTLMFGGAVLLLAGSMPRPDEVRHLEQCGSAGRRDSTADSSATATSAGMRISSAC